MNIKNKSYSFMFRTVITLIIFSTFILGLLYFCQITFLNLYYEKYKIREVQYLAYKLESSNNIENFLEANTTNSDVCSLYVTNENEALYFNENMKGCVLLSKDKTVEKVLNKMISSKKKSSFYTVTNPLLHYKTFLYGLRLENGDYVFINSLLETADSTTVLLTRQLVYLLIIVIFLAVIIAIFISNSITKPIREITENARKMGNGNLDFSFSKSNISEVNELGEMLNYAKEEMIKTDDYRKDLMANVSHDLKTPLTLIKGYAEMIRDISYKDDEKRNKHLNIIVNETDRLNTLVNDILTLSKLENKESLNFENYDVVKEIKEIITKFEILELTEKYNFVLDSPDKAVVYADKNKINQVVYNLITNAINYTGDDQKVTIKVKKNRVTYRVEIIDTGKGIDKELLKHIWDRYYKNEKKHKRNKIGTGLGLSIVRNILEQHKFKYGVNSSKNKGTTFYFYIKVGKEKKSK